MQKVNLNGEMKLRFEPRSGTQFEASNAVNHGIPLPAGKFLFSTGLFIIGELFTDRGRRVEVAQRKLSSYKMHLCADTNYDGNSKEPICIYPEIEANNEIDIPPNFFLPSYNCHGHVFADKQYWINPMIFNRNSSGQIVPVAENIRLILQDEYEEVAEEDNWDIGILVNASNFIVHAVKRNANQIESKYDGYQLSLYDNLDEVDIDRYGPGHFEFFKKT